nr:hypothetical protein [Prevotella sp.]
TCRKYRCLHFEQRAMMGETYVKLIFVKVGRNSNWDVLITTDTHMKFIKAFERKGEEKGAQKEMLKIIRRMKAKGFSIEDISESVGLTEKEVEMLLQ